MFLAYRNTFSVYLTMLAPWPLNVLLASACRHSGCHLVVYMNNSILFDAILSPLCDPISTSMILTRACEKDREKNLIKYESLPFICVFFFFQLKLHSYRSIDLKSSIYNFVQRKRGKIWICFTSKLYDFASICGECRANHGKVTDTNFSE